MTSDLWFFECHYPGQPIMPLSILVECMTQTFCATFLYKSGDKTEIPVLVSLGEIRLKESIVPGDTLRLEAELNSFKRGIAKGSCRAYKNQNQKPICEFDITEALPSLMIRM